MAVCTINAIGDKVWRLDGQLHRDNGPAVEYVDGTRHWHQHGNLHRTDGPAIDCTTGSRQWFKHGARHRDDEGHSASRGAKHRPAVEHDNGSREWWVNGEKHREDGPAIEQADGTKCCAATYLRGNLHRLDGPAIEHGNELHGTQPKLQWWFEGYELTEQQHTRIRSRVARVEKVRAHRIKWFIPSLREYRLLPRLCSPHSAAFMKRFHADWDADTAT